MGRYLAPLLLAGLIAAVAAVVVTGLRAGSHRPSSRSHAALHSLPRYWTVRAGQTLGGISAKTGLTVAQLEALNPNVDPLSLQPGERLKLTRQQPAKPRPKPLGPRFWTVRPGESFGSIAGKTGISIVVLQQLNPQLKPSTLQPGDHVRLRR